MEDSQAKEDGLVLGGSLSSVELPQLLSSYRVEVVGSQLESLDALPAGLAVDGDLRVHANPVLHDVDALGRLARVSGDLVITDNPVLDQGSAEAAAAGVQVGGSVTVSGNGP